MVWIALGIVALLFVGFIAMRARAHGRLISAAHVMEVANALGKLKAVALELCADDRPPSPGDPRVFVSSAGLAVAYTARQVGTTFAHHCSISLGGGYTAHALGATFAAIAAKQLGLPWNEMALLVEQSTVHHAHIDLDAERHAAIAGSTVPTIDLSAARELHRWAFDSRRTPDWQRALPR